MSNIAIAADFAPTGLQILVDGGTTSYRSIVSVSDEVRAWDGTESRFAVQSNTDSNVHAGFEVRVTGRRVRLHKWGMAAVRVQVRFEGESEWIGADVLANALDLEAVKALLQ